MGKDRNTKNPPKSKVKKQVDEEVLARMGIEDEARPPPSRRLKKMSEVNPREELLPKSDISSEEEQVEEPQFKQFGVQDDEDVQREREEEERAKDLKKLKGNQEIDKFMEKPAKGKKKKEEIKPAATQMSLVDMMRIQKENKKKRRRSSDDFIVPDEASLSRGDERQIEARRLAAYETYNGPDHNEQKMIEKAIQLSLTAESKKKEASIQEEYGYQPEAEVVRGPSPPAKKEVKQEHPPEERKKSRKKPTKEKKEKEEKTGPLAGLVIAFTGAFTICDKDELIEVCMQLGAECPKSLAKKCNVLMQGAYVEDMYKRRLKQDINDTQKSVQARARGLQIVPHDDIEKFFEDKTGQSLQSHIAKNKVPNPISSLLHKMMIDDSKEQQKQPVPQKAVIPQDVKEELMEIERPKIQIDSQLWTEKYKPRSLEEVIGQGSQIRQLRQWLSAWEDIHIQGNKREVKEHKGGWAATGNINSKAALLSGDPGIGKTTSARLVAADCHYGANEFNASDVRSKKNVGLLEWSSLQIGAARNLQKSVMIMDEVDGMSSGDRGGITEIIKMIKESKVPVICICNDRASQKIRSLAGHCLDIRFHKPNKGQVVRRLKQILNKEGGIGQDRALDQLVECFQNDMRQILSYLQVVFSTVSKRITVDALKSRGRFSKDAAVMISPFDAVRRLLNRSEFSGMSLNERNQCFFIDSDLVPLMVHENLLSSARKSAYDAKKFHRFVEGMKGLTLADQLDRQIRRTQDYGLMPSYAYMSSVYPAQKISQSLGYPQFPSWLGKNSSQRKAKRLSKQLKNYLFPETKCSDWRASRFQYGPLIIHILVDLLRQEEIEEAVEVMEQYRLTPLALQEHLSSLQGGSEKSSALSEVPPAIKAKLTRFYNRRHEDAKMKAQKGGKAKAEHNGKFNPVLEEVEQDNMEEEEPEKQEEELVEEAKPKTKGKVKGRKK